MVGTLKSLWTTSALESQVWRLNLRHSSSITDIFWTNKEYQILSNDIKWPGKAPVDPGSEGMRSSRGGFRGSMAGVEFCCSHAVGPEALAQIDFSPRCRYMRKMRLKVNYPNFKQFNISKDLQTWQTSLGLGYTWPLPCSTHLVLEVARLTSSWFRRVSQTWGFQASQTLRHFETLETSQKTSTFNHIPTNLIATWYIFTPTPSPPSPPPHPSPSIQPWEASVLSVRWSWRRLISRMTCPTAPDSSAVGCGARGRTRSARHPRGGSASGLARAGQRRLSKSKSLQISHDLSKKNWDFKPESRIN